MSRVGLLNRRFLGGMLCGVLLLVGARLVIEETAIADRLVAPLLLTDTPGAADAIVVLGAGVIGECVPNLNGVRRAMLAARLFRERRARIVLFTGGASQGTCAVSVAMAHLAKELGVPDANIRLEEGSHSTRENGELSAPILRGEGARRLLIVSDRLHMRRAAGVFAKEGFDVELASVPVYEGHTDNTSMLLAGLREMVALTYYNRKGWVADVHPGAPTVTAQLATPASEIGTLGVAAAPDPTGSAMQTQKNTAGPIVILGASYAKSWKPGSIDGISVISSGVAGQQSFEMQERFDRDVAVVHPRAVILWGFINDIFRAEDVAQAQARIRDSYTTMIAQARKAKIEPIVATEVTIAPPDSWKETVTGWIGGLLGKESYQDRINRHVIETNRWLSDVAAREHLLLLDLHGALAESGGRRRREFIDADGSHITAAGYEALTRYAVPVLTRHFASRGKS